MLLTATILAPLVGALACLVRAARAANAARLVALVASLAALALAVVVATASTPAAPASACWRRGLGALARHPLVGRGGRHQRRPSR